MTINFPTLGNVIEKVSATKRKTTQSSKSQSIKKKSQMLTKRPLPLQAKKDEIFT